VYLRCDLQQSLLFEVLRDDNHGLLDARLLRVDVDLWVLRSLVWSADTSELLDLTSSCLLVQALRIALLCLLNWDVHEDLNEWQRLVILGVGVELARKLAVGLVWRDEGSESNRGRVCEELGDLVQCVRAVMRQVTAAGALPLLCGGYSPLGPWERSLDPC
jgi:hypothetical protein